MLRLQLFLIPLLAVLALGACDTSTEPVRRPTQLRLNPTSVTLRDGDSLRVEVTITDQDGVPFTTEPAGMSIVWTSSADSVATVQNGLIVARRPGTARIMARLGELSAEVLVTVEPVPTALVRVAGDEQRAVVGTPLGDSLVVRVVDRHGNGVAGVAVQFEVTSGGGNISPASAVSGPQGFARARWTVGPTPGPQTARATAVGSTVQFTATATPRPVATVRVTPAADTLQVGATRQLTAAAVDATGAPVADVQFVWASSDTSVAVVSASGVMVARRPGVVTITATAPNGVVGSARITVIAPTVPPSGIACEPGATGVTLQQGQVMTVNAQQQPTICLVGGSGSEYTLIPYHAAASTARLAVEVAGNGVIPAVGPPNPSLLRGGSAAISDRVRMGANLPLDRRLDRRLREWERRHMAVLRGTRASRAAPTNLSRAAVTLSVPSVGDTLHLNVNADEGCTNPRYRVGRVEAVTQRAIIVGDTSNPTGGFTREEYRALGITFDTLVWKVDVANFGAPEDLDRNGRVLVFYTRAVNELTEPNSNSVVGGFFYGRDLFPRSGTGSTCPGSNQAEMFYMLVPDPGGVVNGNERTKEYVLGTTVSVLAHEFQHLINFSRRLYVNNASSNEETWLNEGLSHIAEELVFYEATNLLPESNLTRERALTEPIRARFIEYQLGNFGRYLEYLKNPPDASPLADDDDLSTRGATWAFLRYAADRKADPTGQQRIWFDLVNSRTSGVQNLQNVLGVNPIDWLEDWTVSVYTDDSGLTVDPRHQQPSWNFRSIYPAFRSTNGQYPLSTVPLASGESNRRTFSLQGGGAAFLRFGIAGGQRAAIRISSGSQIPPARLRVMIVRTK